MNKFKQVTAIILALMTSFSALSCGDQEKVKPDNNDSTESDLTDTSIIEQNTDKNGFLLDSLPEDLDFNNETLTILGWNHYEDIEFYAEELTGDVVNDAYFNRNRAVEERLNVKLEFLEANARDNTFLTVLNASVMSGTGEYDVVAAHSHRMTSAASQGLLLNLLDAEYIDLEKPWWSSLLRETTTIGGSLMFAAGDISISSISRMQGIFFNNNIIEVFKLEDPYDLVLSGNWTLDKLMEMSAGVYSDLNGNDKKDEADRFGFASDDVQLQAAFFSAGLKAVEHSSNGGLILSPLFSGERSVELLAKLAGFLHNTNDATKISIMDDDKIFTEGRGLFYAFPLGLISSAHMREAKFNYGFVPWPKYAKEDDTYYTSSSNAFSIWGIPLDAANPDISGALMEALASGGYRMTSPALFETAYKVKYNNIDSERQSRIFDMMKTNIVYDVAKLFSNVIPFVGHSYAYSIYTNNLNWSSAVESNRVAIQEALNKLVITFNENSKTQ